MSDHGNAPLLVHCAAGKDRTGVVIAVILALLGVPDGPICDDYARSAAAWATSPDEMPRIAPQEAMRLFLAELRDRYGTVLAYGHRLGLDDDALNRLRAAALQPPSRD